MSGGFGGSGGGGTLVGDAVGAIGSNTVPNVLGGQVPATNPHGNTQHSSAFGTIARSITFKSGAYTVLDTDDVIDCTPSTSYAITLPNPTSADTLTGNGTHAGRAFTVRREPGTGTITVQVAGGALINGAATYTMLLDRQMVSFVCDGTGWLIQTYQPEVSRQIAFQSLTAVPSATLNVFGPVQTMIPDAGFTSFIPLRVAWTSGGVFGAETLTCRFRAFFSDGSNQSTTVTFTATGATNALNDNQVLAVCGKDGVYITSIDFAVQSTINGSTANAVGKCYAANAA